MRTLGEATRTVLWQYLGASGGRLQGSACWSLGSSRLSLWLGPARQRSTSLGKPSILQHAENPVLILEKTNVGQRVAVKD
jgi:hypothetical protein